MGLFENLKNKIKGFDFDGLMQDAFGSDPKEEQASPTDDVVRELQGLTTDDEPELVVLRALGIYRTIVHHVKAGGTVKFITRDAKVRTLKVRIR